MAFSGLARIGWMKWCRSPKLGDKKPVGGGSHNKRLLGNEAFNFLPLGGHMLGYLQPKQNSNYASSIALERIKAGFSGAELKGVLVVFVATDPKRGGQRIIGWFPNATAYRHERTSNDKRRNYFSYFVKTPAEDAVLIPENKRLFIIPRGKGTFGQANVCYALDTDGQPKN